MNEKMQFLEWDTLPFEILKRIFQCLEFTADKRATFTALQLVCKSWKLPAQEVFFRDICLDRDDANFNIALENLEPQVLDSIKIITFSRWFSLMKNRTKIVEFITERCQGIEEIHTSTGSTADLVYSSLASEKNRIRKLQILGGYNFTQLNEQLYTTIALRYKDSFSDLYLLDENAEYDDMPQPLFQQLKSFVALKKLTVNTTADFDYAKLEQLVNDCSITVRTLKFDRLTLSEFGDESLPDHIKPKHNIQDLKIFGPDPVSLVYLEAKFKALKNLDLQYIEYQATDPWWDRFNNFCSPLKTFRVGLYSTYGDIGKSYEECIHLMYGSDSKDKKILHLYFGQDGHVEWNSFELTLKKEKGHRSIDVLTYNQSNPFEVHRFLNFPGACYPDQVTISLDNTEGVIDTFLPLDLPSFMPPGEIKTIIEDNNELFFNWKLFNQSLSLISQAQDPCLSFESIILFVSLLPYENSMLDLSNLSFHDSILEHGVFPYMSQRIESIDLLEIDSCSILMDEQYTLNIFLPFTKIYAFSLISGALKVSLDSSMFYSDEYHEGCELQNVDFLQAVHRDEQYTLKIETSARTYVFQRKGELLSESSKQDIVYGSSNNFLIWIKCLDLDEFSIANGLQFVNFEKLQK